ncbi:hypothetical protein ACJJTC_002302 [Scirpophaga incertulas]
MDTAIRAFCVIILLINNAESQILQFGACPIVETVKYFDIERFLGQWHVLERYPVWYEDSGQCSSKRIETCGRRVEIEYTFVQEGVQYVLKMNSTYKPGDEAIFYIQDNRIDPISVPVNVIATNYIDYALIYGCKVSPNYNIKYTVAWILSRNKFLPEQTLQFLRLELNAIPYTSPAYLKLVSHDEESCTYHWTANIQAPDIDEEE